jgi:hypothetical protein
VEIQEISGERRVTLSFRVVHERVIGFHDLPTAPPPHQNPINFDLPDGSSTTMKNKAKPK